MKSPLNEPDESEESVEPKGCLSALLGLFGIRLRASEDVPADQSLPYRLTQRFLTPAELSFYKVAIQVLPDGFMINAKTRIGDILFVPRGTKGDWALKNKVQRKHVDFLVCDAQTMAPRLAIELDDKSHDRIDRQERDIFVDQAFAAAGLEVLHIQVRSSWVPHELRSVLLEKLSKKPHTPAAPQTRNGIPVCPHCRTPMVLRTAGRSSNRGKQFWGCANFPDCRFIVDKDSG